MTAETGMRRRERIDRGIKVRSDGIYAVSSMKEVLYLARVEGLSMDEISERMGRSPKAVREIFGRALLKLRKRSGETGRTNKGGSEP